MTHPHILAGQPVRVDNVFFTFPVESKLRLRAMDDRESDLLAFFECQCRGIQFYDFRDVTLRHGTPLFL